MTVISATITFELCTTYQYISFSIAIDIKEFWLVSTSCISFISNQCICCSVSEVTATVILQKLYLAKFCTPRATCPREHNHISIAIFVVIMINNSHMVIDVCCICA